jgi:hypothetical protein
LVVMFVLLMVAATFAGRLNGYLGIHDHQLCRRMSD